MEKSDDYVLIAPGKEVSIGSTRILMILRVLIYSLLTLLFVVACQVVSCVFLDMGCNPILLRAVSLLVIFLLISCTCSLAVRTLRTSYFVESGILYGSGECIDLMTLYHVKIRRHRVYLNDVLFTDIPSTKIFLNSLDEIYFELTGEYLP